MEINMATHEDIESLAQLLPDVHDIHLEAFPENFKPITHERAKSEFEKLLSQENVKVLLARTEAEAIGYIVVLIQHRPESDLCNAKSMLYIEQKQSKRRTEIWAMARN